MLKTYCFYVFFKNFMAPFYEWGSNVSRLQSHCEETIYFLPLSLQEFLVLILSTSEEWKTESNLEPPSGFELGTPSRESSALTTRPFHD